MEPVTEKVFLGQFAASGTLYISVDEKLFYTQKFGHRIKVEIAFDNVDEIKGSQQFSVDSPSHKVNDGVTDPVDSPSHEVDGDVSYPVDSPGDEEILIDDDSTLKVKFDNVSNEAINTKEAETSIIKEIGNVQRKRAYNCKEEKTVSASKPSVPKKRAVSSMVRSTKNLKAKYVTDQTDKSKEAVSVKIELDEDNTYPDAQDADSNEKAFIGIKGSSVKKKGKKAFNINEESTTINSTLSGTKRRVKSNTSRRKLSKNLKRKPISSIFMPDKSKEAVSEDNSDDQETQVKSENDTCDDDPSKVVSCPYCSKSFINQEKLLQHRKVDTKEQFPCPKCHRIFRFKAFFMAHMISQHQEETEKTSDNSELIDSDGKFVKCEFCGVVYSHVGNLKLHLMSHTSEYSYQCCVCPQKWCSYPAYLSHMKTTHSKSGPVKCNICDILFCNRTELAKHRTTHSLNCGLCGQEFTSRTARNVHYKHFHKNDDNLLKCAQCSKLYSSKEALDLHLQYHKYNKTTQCPVCGDFFTRLKRHMSRAHASEQNDGEPSDNRFVCDKCPKQFINKSSLDNHLRRHSGEKRYKCPECSKQFPYNSGLCDHYMAVHSKEKPYVCKICGKACSLKGNLKKHMMQVHKTDSLTKDMQCTHCGESFTQRKALEEHVDKEHCFEDATSLLQFPPQYFQMNTSSHGQFF